MKFSFEKFWEWIYGFMDSYLILSPKHIFHHIGIEFLAGFCQSHEVNITAQKKNTKRN